jgi:protein-S-isoprenylcysteine O-methyltransferase Ste14
MKNLLKQIFSFILPVTVLVFVPLWIEKDWTIRVNFFLFAGSILVLIGLMIMVVCISAFIRIGRGTLAPWSPTKKLVITGLYRYVRNPMILGVLIALIGEAFALRSLNIMIWAASFFIINTIYFIVYEEPNLEDRFGSEYVDYKKHVSRWLPKRKPYDQRDDGSKHAKW